MTTHLFIKLINIFTECQALNLDLVVMGNLMDNGRKPCSLFWFD